MMVEQEGTDSGVPLSERITITTLHDMSCIVPETLIPTQLYKPLATPGNAVLSYIIMPHHKGILVSLSLFAINLAPQAVTRTTSC